MTTSTSGGSAQIYQFPPRGRFALNADSQSRTGVESQPLVKVAAGSGWYHDAAIQEGEPRSN